VYGGVTYKTGFRLNDWICYTLYIHTTRDYRHYSAIAILPTLQFTGAHALGFSVSTSRILATDLSVSLSLQITHEVCFSQPSSFLAIILQLPIPKTLLNSIPISYPGRLASRNSVLYFRLMFCTAKNFLITSLHGPNRKHSLC
jgi:hypothetical protein